MGAQKGQNGEACGRKGLEQTECPEAAHDSQPDHDHPADQGAAHRCRNLSETRRHVLRLSAEQAAAAVFEHPQPTALVHSFPEEDLHFLVHDIGPQNALPLLNLASTRQWEYLLDMEVWSRDRLDYQQATAWLQLLLRADPQRLIQWCFGDKLEFLELYLYRNIELRIRESEEAPSDFGDGFFSDDDTFYVRFVDYPVVTPQEQATKDRRDQLLGQLLRRLSLFDHPRYQSLLLEAAGTIPGETEEELFRLRNVRLAEKGFLPSHEAVGVYQPLRPGDIDTRWKRAPLQASSEDAAIPVPQFASAFLEGDNLFTNALKGIHDPEAIQQLQVELAGLCNQVVAADQSVIRSRKQLREVVAKVSGYLSIGLEQLTRPVSVSRERHAAALLQRHLLADIFRTGFSGALQLKWEAARWRKTSWFQAQGLDLTFWGEAWLGLLGGLFIDRPKFYDPSDAAVNYRDFKTLREITASDRDLKRIEALDRLLGLMQIQVAQGSGGRLLTYKNLLLTQWARDSLKLPPIDSRQDDMAIALAEFKPFYEALWSKRQHGSVIGDARRADFLAWTAQASGTPAPDLSGRLGETFEALFDELEAELASVNEANLDPRYIHLILLKS